MIKQKNHTTRRSIQPYSQRNSYMLVAPPVLVAVAVGLALIVVFFLSGSSKTEKAPPVVCSCIQESLPQRWRIPGIPILLLRLTD